jgi:hypothetical protein
MILFLKGLKNHLAKGPIVDFGYIIHQKIPRSVPDDIGYKFLDKYPDIIRRVVTPRDTKPKTDMDKELTKYSNKQVGRYKDKANGTE